MSPYQFGTRSAATEELQRALTEHGFDTHGVDGIFGRDTRDAVEAAQEHFSISPADGVPRSDLLSFLGLVAPPEPKRRTTLQDLLTKAAIGAALSRLLPTLKGLPMLSGYKTYATAAVLAVMAAYSVLFGDLPLVGHVDPGSALMALLSSLGLVFGRAGAKADVSGK